MLRIAVPNKGTLSESAIALLREAGYATRRDPKELTLLDKRNGVEFFYLRPRDIATYVGSGALDVGITGRDLLLESGSSAVEVLELDFGASTFRFAGPVDKFRDLDDLAEKRIATSYDTLVEGFLVAQGVNAKVIRLDGAVESAVRLGVADAVADVVETGYTLRVQGLATFGPVILKSVAVLIARPWDSSPDAERFLRRIQGVLLAHRYVLLDYDLPEKLLGRAVQITPGLESPTISPLQDKSWVAVRVMVPRSESHQAMDELYALGARAILVSAIHAARI